jgi:HlyD family secretion protein
METRSLRGAIAPALVSGALSMAGCSLQSHQPDGSGTIECTQVQVAPQVPGRVVRLPLQEGAAVRKGELVAQLDTTDYDLRLQEARAVLAQSQAQLDLALAGNRDEDVQRARAQVREAEAAARAAQADLARITQVYERKSATQKQMDDASAQAERAAAALAAAQQMLARLTRGSRQEEIRIARAQADLAKARVAQAEKSVADCAVAAPLDGVVSARSREEGEMAAAGAPLCTISRLDEVWLSIYVPESRLPALRIGASATVRLDGATQSYTGKVTFIASEAEFTPRNVQTRDERAKLVYRVKIALPNVDRRFKPGMPADGFLEKAP